MMRLEKIDNFPKYRILNGTEELGTVEMSRNPFHEGCCYLNFRLRGYNDSVAAPLFEALRRQLGKPLQVMTSSAEEALTHFLTIGGFHLMRRCFEVEVSKDDLRAADGPTASFSLCCQGQPDYQVCCQLLYRIYAENHASISPLTASFDTFCEALPRQALCQSRDGQVEQFAFIEENEIAYVGSTDLSRFPAFIRGVLKELFAQHETVFFECDDCDSTAMAMRDLFSVEEAESFDTYVYK